MNSYLKRLALVAATLSVAAVLAVPSLLHGDEWNFKTYITVNQPFQVPGAVLEPNMKYVLRRLDGNGGTNHVVRVMNAEETKVLTTFLAVSDWRLEPEDDTVLTFMETAPGYPKPVKSWFYPGRLDGLEFMYSKQQRAEIAQHAPGATAEMQTARLEETQILPPLSTEPAPAVTEEQPAPSIDTDVQREKPSDVDNNSVEVEESSTSTAVEPAPSENTNSEPESLPATGSELPLLALLGISLVGLGKTFRSR
jgi:hypothetical protein